MARIVVLVPGVGARSISSPARMIVRRPGRPDARGVSDQEVHRPQIHGRSRGPDIGHEGDRRRVARAGSLAELPPRVRGRVRRDGLRSAVPASAPARSVPGRSTRRVSSRGRDDRRPAPWIGRDLGRRGRRDGRRGGLAAAGRAALGHRLASGRGGRPGRHRQRRRDRREGDPEATSDAGGEGHGRSSGERRSHHGYSTDPVETGKPDVGPARAGRVHPRPYERAASSVRRRTRPAPAGPTCRPAGRASPRARPRPGPAGNGRRRGRGPGGPAAGPTPSSHSALVMVNRPPPTSIGQAQLPQDRLQGRPERHALEVDHDRRLHRLLDLLQAERVDVDRDAAFIRAARRGLDRP